MKTSDADTAAARAEISVIVPVYNASRWLPELFRSLEEQTMEDFEVILVDDGSSDSSGELCAAQQRRDSRFRHCPRANRGVSAARNAGISRARGNWIYFIDADDMLHPEALARLVETARATGADIVLGGFSEGESMPPSPRRREPRLMTAREAILTSLYQTPPLNYIWGVLYRRSIFEYPDTRFREGIRYEDLDIAHRLFERARSIAWLPEELYFYRSHPQSFIHTLSRGRLDAVEVTDRIVERYRGTPLEKAALSRSFSASFNVLALLLRTGYEAPEMLERVWENVRRGRRRALTDPRVRMKNRIGALLSYGGLPILKCLARISRAGN
ncbi:MAG: glycosyltransferase [Muribaculaceae bacterium]|nr:glycosyltransferase [Muribaculaceae bacterium]